MQAAEVVEEGAKLKWLTDRLPGFIDQGDVLVFASQKVRVDELTDKLKAGGFRWGPAACLHHANAVDGVCIRYVTCICQALQMLLYSCSALPSWQHHQHGRMPAAKL